jgi:hypothetical protein
MCTNFFSSFNPFMHKTHLLGFSSWRGWPPCPWSPERLHLHPGLAPAAAAPPLLYPEPAPPTAAPLLPLHLSPLHPALAAVLPA